MIKEVITDIYIFSFDGRVLEIFEPSGTSKRYHVAGIASIFIQGEKYNLALGIENLPFGHITPYPFAESYQTEIEDLVDTITRFLI